MKRACLALVVASIGLQFVMGCPASTIPCEQLWEDFRARARHGTPDNCDIVTTELRSIDMGCDPDLLSAWLNTYTPGTSVSELRDDLQRQYDEYCLGITDGGENGGGGGDHSAPGTCSNVDESCVNDGECCDGLDCSDRGWCTSIMTEVPFCSMIDCDDRLFCNGTETCIEDGGYCLAGTPPCSNDETCDEDRDACIQVDACQNRNCDDALFCNGTETCVEDGGYCEAGTPPCTDGQTCDEELDICEADENAGLTCEGFALDVVWRYDSEATPKGVAAKDNYVYVSYYNPSEYHGELAIFDASDPASVFRVGSYVLGCSYCAASQIVIAGDRAYVAWTSSSSTGFEVLDVSAAASPRLLGSFESGGGSFWDGESPMAVAGFKLAIKDEERPYLFDVSNPEDVEVLGPVPFHQTSASAFAMSERHLYLTGESGFRVIDISDMSSPELVSACCSCCVGDTETYDGVHYFGASSSVVLKGNYAYVAFGWAGLQVFDISNPGSPVRVGGHDTPGGLYSDLGDRSGQRVVVSGNTAWLASMITYANDGFRHTGFLEMIDVSDPLQPVCQGSVEMSVLPRHIALLDERTCVVTTDESVLIIRAR